MQRVQQFAVEVPGVDEVHERVVGGHAGQEGRAVHRHPRVHRPHRYRGADFGGHSERSFIPAVHQCIKHKELTPFPKRN